MEDTRLSEESPIANGLTVCFAGARQLKAASEQAIALAKAIIRSFPVEGSSWLLANTTTSGTNPVRYVLSEMAALDHQVGPWRESQLVGSAAVAVAGESLVNCLSAIAQHYGWCEILASVSHDAAGMRFPAGYLTAAPWQWPNVPPIPERPVCHLRRAAHRASKVARAVFSSISVSYQEKPSRSAEARHSEDFSSVNWFGTLYTFTSKQRSVVEALWKGWENRTPELSQEFLMDKAESESTLPVLFKDREGPNRTHSAWGTMIVAGSRKGLFKLNSPSPTQIADVALR